MSQESVQVIIRCRPFSKSEKDRGCKNICTIDSPAHTIQISKDSSDLKSFTFDASYGEDSQQLDVYNESAKPIVEAVLQGYNGTIFAYGQTGTGKTFTMQGLPMDVSMRGIIPSTFHQIFEFISQAPHVRFLVTVSFMEIYNEDVRDLMVTTKSTGSLELKEHPETGVYVKDLSKHIVKSVEEMDALMTLGNKNRSVGSTLMNAESSRSHSIFSIHVESCVDVGTEQKIVAGKLHLVDLAGSERQGKTGATGQRLKEAAKINLSLTALGNCISSLVDGKSTHIPYRDSKLTRLLQDSLGGNSKTLMIATVSPADYNFDETLSTLRWANRAKSIKNKPVVNEDPKDATLNQYQDEIKRLKELLQQRASGGTSRPVNSGGKVSSFGGAQVLSADMTEDQYQAAQLQIQKELKALADSKDVAQSNRDKTISDLSARQQHLKQERQERFDLDAKLKMMESQLVVGGKDLSARIQEQRETFEQRQKTLQETKAREEKMKRALEKKQEEASLLEETSGSLQDEVALKTRKLKKLWTKLESIKNETTDLQDEFYREKVDYMELIRELAKELQLREKIVDVFVPPQFSERVKQCIQYSDDTDEWVMGNAVKSDLKISKPLTFPLPEIQRPISTYGRWSMATRQNDMRYQLEHIISPVPLYTPEQITREFRLNDDSRQFAGSKYNEPARDQKLNSSMSLRK